MDNFKYIILIIGIILIPYSYALPQLPALPHVYNESDMPLSALPMVYVEKFTFTGNTVYSDEFLSDLVADYQKRDISAEELQIVKNIISNQYIDAGFINSGAIIPDQKVIAGIINLKIIEGKLVDIEINQSYKEQAAKVHLPYIHQRLAGDQNEVLNLNRLQERLQLLHQNPLFRSINAELRPGINLGEGILHLNIIEETPWEIGMRFNNYRAPSIGSERAEVFAIHRNLSGWGDSLQARLGLTSGLRDYAVSYMFPIDNSTSLGMSVERSDAAVVAEPFNQLNIESEASTYSLHLNHALIQIPNQEFNLGLKLEQRSSTTYLFRGMPLEQKFSFSPGVQDGESKITALRFSQDWLERSRNRVIAARSSFNFGLDFFNATINPDGMPDGKFFTWLGQFQWVQRIAALGTENTQLLFRADMQWSKHDLLPLEKFAVGGGSTVRGYRENQLIRDSGIVASIEWRIPLIKLTLPYFSRGADDGMLQIASFIDYGRAWNKADTPNPKSISSAGLGLRWLPNQRTLASVYWGRALRNLDKANDYDLQDDGIHFEVTISFP
jgi:hemolysin activation/secretion protein